ncbi:MAG: hypothetical protein FWC36_00565 [Spirochaetes bacterium]|nr:hypothetical protein [Spirochaetota bacterium]
MEKTSCGCKTHNSLTPVILASIMLLVIFLLCVSIAALQNQKRLSAMYEERLDLLESSLKEELENEMYLVNGSLSGLNASLETLTRMHLAAELRLSGRISVTNSNISSLNEIYQSILEEHSKRRLESLYSDKYLADKMADASLLLAEGKVNQAHLQYVSIVSEQPENHEARFYMYYTLFLRNRFDREEYPEVRAGFLRLKNEGYVRKEMQEVLSFIDLEGGVIETLGEVND